ncbi:MAG: GTP-binding protein, partial [Clostridia bacterium]|nr:GTP-binding protein [Clostridia bacterium]
MKEICIGALAHVDAGKTTLSEALLYRTGNIRKLGRVDHKDSFLDTDVQERERGITIFSKQAVLQLPEVTLTLLDTPGHVDFSAEMERTLQVLDYAVLVISGPAGVQGHTHTLWSLLRRFQIPTILFINKMDMAGTDQQAIMASLQKELSEACVDFSCDKEELFDAVSLLDEDVMDHYLQTEQVSDGDIAALIQRRRLFPCFFGSALRLDGVD